MFLSFSFNLIKIYLEFPGWGNFPGSLVTDSSLPMREGGEVGRGGAQFPSLVRDPDP